jgi:beta-glucosidase
MKILESEPSAVKVSSHVEHLISQMTLAEKIGQMTQADQRAVQPADVTHYGLGSLLSGGGSNPTPNNPQNWAEMVSACQEAALKTRLGIPLIYGVDAVHGHSNVVGATIFPHNIGLGATRDARLVERIARATALETSATGVYWDFAPCVAVPQDIRWGRTYEGFSENTDLVVDLGAAYVRGLQGILGAPGSVLACPKHFVGDGGTTWGTTQQYEWLEDYWQAADDRYQIDQGNTQLDESSLRKIHLAPYLSAIQAGARSIMVSFSSWNGEKMHAHHYLLTEVLKGELGFTGFLVSDWRAIDQLSADPYERVVLSINAGLDMIMVPFEYQPFMDNLEKAVQAGDVSIQRIDDAVGRILSVKEELGLFARKPDDEPRPECLGNVEHRQLAQEAVRKSLVLLKNEYDTLPIAKDMARIAVVGPAGDDIGLQCGGWTIEWLGGTGDITLGTSLLTAIRNTVSPATSVHFDPQGDFPGQASFDLGIVCLHEIPYAEGVGDRADLNLNAEEISLLAKVRSRCRRLVVIILSGRPLIITRQLPLADAVVAAWLPGTEGQGIADVLFGDYPFTGKLPYSWPRAMDQVPFDFPNIPSEGCAAPLFPYGYGLQTGETAANILIDC